ncbi:transcriptional modulator of MazE/toxin, MazF [Stanieria cyanosphaera PCC 7437]|uniref:Transcriptional modulator of MazE/toxin, MazF n=1 Tax=Stanieria cyanosphaera (strain ATCC 29371 / PCC 7437) TaxID=111780 RepID=K9XWN4_STAC7|nr:type II toxin-antitoxin system PemK/MazF family toxin [Stanieria cyanosphaera]AFZ37005.1 transcriptional modulator of MazE/toxin, MazF [Stanieria cyanosphaera PCC 7437]
MVKYYIPDRGDIIKLSFSPQQGKEQAGIRPALVISPVAYNRISHFILACPITSQVKGWRFEVVLPQGLNTYGVILADQVRLLDWQIRQAKLIEKAPSEVIEEVLARLSPLVS